MLNKAKPYSRIYGKPGVAFEQDGRLYNSTGQYVGGRPEETIAEVQPKIKQPEKPIEKTEPVKPAEKSDDVEPKKRKPPSQMTVAELLKEGAENGRDFTGMKKKEMVGEIREIRGLS